MVDRTVHTRVSQSGEGVPRRVTPEEGLAIKLSLLRAGRADFATQRGWDLAVEHLSSLSLSQIDRLIYVMNDLTDWLARRGVKPIGDRELLASLRAMRAELTATQEDE